MEGAWIPRAVQSESSRHRVPDIVKKKRYPYSQAQVIAIDPVRVIQRAEPAKHAVGTRTNMIDRERMLKTRAALDDVPAVGDQKTWVAMQDMDWSKCVLGTDPWESVIVSVTFFLVIASKRFRKSPPGWVLIPRAIVQLHQQDRRKGLTCLK
jgi:hypothetical protein